MLQKEITHLGTTMQLSTHQLQCVETLLEAHRKGIHIALLNAMPQAGKTAVCVEFCKRLEEMGIPSAGMIVMTGMSDNEWREQTRARFPESMRDNILHRSNVEQAKWSSVRVIIWDEAHFGSGAEHLLNDILSRNGLYDVQQLQSREVFVLLVSATPAHMLQSLRDTLPKTEHIVVNMRPAEGYKSAHVMQEDGQLCEYNDGEFDLVAEIENFSRPKYHLVRLLHNCNFTRNLADQVEALRMEDAYIVDAYDSKHDFVPEDLENTPEKHTIVVVKNYFRAAKTLRVEALANIGFVVDPSNDTNVQAQNMVGRLCGYGRPVYVKHECPTVYCNVDRVLEYFDWRETQDLDYGLCQYHSATLNSDATKHPSYKDSALVSKTSLKPEFTRNPNLVIRTTKLTTFESACKERIAVRSRKGISNTSVLYSSEDAFLKQQKKDAKGRYIIPGYKFVTGRQITKDAPAWLEKAIHRVEGTENGTQIFPYYKNKDSAEVLYFVVSWQHKSGNKRRKIA